VVDTEYGVNVADADGDGGSDAGKLVVGPFAQPVIAIPAKAAIVAISQRNIKRTSKKSKYRRLIRTTASA
jgi:uncharacterized protein (DUF2345 family)